jgi:hypothetical protein
MWKIKFGSTKNKMDRTRSMVLMEPEQANRHAADDDGIILPSVLNTFETEEKKSK